MQRGGLRRSGGLTTACLLAALWLWCAATPALAALTPALLLDKHTQHASLVAHLSRWVDADATSTLAQARQQVFQPLAGFENTGFTTAAHWYRLQLARSPDAPTRWLLVFQEPYLDQIEAWVEHADGTVQTYRLGDHVPMAERPVRSHQNLLALDLPDSQPYQVWLRITSTSMVSFSADVWTPQAFADQESRESLLLGALLGVVLVVALLFTGIGLLAGKPVFVAYAFFAASQGFRHMVISGHSQWLFDPQHPWQSNLIQSLGALAPVLSGMLFVSYLLNLRQHFPWLFRVFQAMGAVTVLSLGWIASPAYGWFAPLILQWGSLLAVLGLVLTFVSWWRQRRWEMLLYVLGFLLVVVLALLQFAILRSWLSPDWVSTRIYQASTLLHMGVMSLALGLRLYQSQREQARIRQHSALLQERQTEQRRFIAMLSHEFRNPLASIDRAANLLQLKLGDLPAGEAARLGGIRSSVQRLESLVDSFLVSEAVDQHRLTPVLRLQPVAPLLAQVMQAQGAEAQARLQLHVAPPELQFALDARLLGIAVGNLLGNALRYSGDSSSVTLSARLDGTDLLLTVTDQGPGLSGAELAQLGEAYYRASNSVGKQGTGLGYFFSRSLVEAHGGTLQAVNQPGRGLQVSLRLPGGAAISNTNPMKFSETCAESHDTGAR